MNATPENYALAIIIITVFVSYHGFSNALFKIKYALQPYEVKRKNKYYQFITSGFLHADWLHLGLNMFVFYNFAPTLMYFFQMHFNQNGIILFIPLYITGIIISDIPSYYKHQDSPSYLSLGASGGVASILYAFIAFEPLSDFYILGSIPIPAWLFGIAYIGASYYQGKKSNDNINHDAHMWGAIYGLVYVFILKPEMLSRFINLIQLKYF